MPEGKGYKKVSKRVSESDAAYSAHGAKAPSPGREKLGETGPMWELKPTKGKQPEQGSKSIDQASKDTASMEPARKMGKSGKGKDSRAASAESASKLSVKGPNEGKSYKSEHSHKSENSHGSSHSMGKSY